MDERPNIPRLIAPRPIHSLPSAHLPLIPSRWRERLGHTLGAWTLAIFMALTVAFLWQLG